ncbi:MAG: MFS transporter [Spirochaetales bacterium]|nr:MFS transporter [Spirochaetales bacterium]
MEKQYKDGQYRKFCLYGFIKNLQFFDPYLVFFFLESGLHFLQIGLLFSIREIATNILEIPTGMAADIAGRRRTMVFSFLSYICSFLLFFFFRSFPMQIAAMILFAFGEAFRTGTHKAMIFEYMTLKKITHLKVAYYGHTRGWAQLGSALSALIAAAIVFIAKSYRHVFLFTAFPYVAGLFLMMSYPKELDGTGGDGSASIKERAREVFGGFIKLFTTGTTRKALANSSLFDAFFKTSKDYLQPVLAALALSLPLMTGLGDQQRIALITGMVYCLLYILTSRASMSAGFLTSGKRKDTTVLNLTWLTAAVFLAASGFFLRWDLALPAVILFILYYVLENLRRPVTLGYVSDRIERGILASGLSGESQAKSLFVAVFAPLLGFLADTFSVGIALALFGGLVVLLYPFMRLRK